MRIETFEDEVTLRKLEQVTAPIHAPGACRFVADGPHDEAVHREGADLCFLGLIQQRASGHQPIAESEPRSPEVEELVGTGGTCEDMHVSLRACRPNKEQRNKRHNEDNHRDQAGSAPPLHV